MKRLALLLVALLLLAPAVSAGEDWEKQLGSSITAVATDEYGDRIFVGTADGYIYVYDSGGSLLFSDNDALFEIYSLATSQDGSLLSSCGHALGHTRASYFAVTPTGSLSRIALFGILTPTHTQIDNAGNYRLYVSTEAALYSHNHTWPVVTRSGQHAALAGDGSWIVSGSTSTLTLDGIRSPLPDNWGLPRNNRAAHTITGTTAALTNYPVEITVIKGSGTSTGNTLYAPDCQSNFGDIRFTAADGVTELPYYLKSVSGSTATFLVNVPSIPASPGTVTIYTYWQVFTGSSAATTTSDPDAATLPTNILDDFNGTELNTDLWEPFGTASISVSDGHLTITGNGFGYSGIRSTTEYTLSDGDIPYLEAKALVNGDLGDVGSFWIGFFGDGQVPNSPQYELDATLKRAVFTEWNSDGNLRASTADGSTRASAILGAWGTITSYKTYQIELNGTHAVMQREGLAEQAVANIPTTPCTIILAVADTSSGYGDLTMQVDYVRYLPPPPDHGAWSAVESIVTFLDTETLTGTIVDIDAPETGDWVAVSTTTKTYIIQVTDSGFGTIYNDDRVGTAYEVAVADGGSFVIEGRSILADIFRIDATQVGTYTTGGPVQHVALAQKNGLYAAAGSDDGKYYVFSKDAASSWYLLHSSDSYDPVTALAMSWRGELLIVGRADGTLVAYRLTEEELLGSIKVTIFKDGAPYRDATIYAERSDGEGGWRAPIPLTSDDYGIISIPVNWGDRVRITADDETREFIATPSQPEYVIRIKGPAPLRTGAQYSSTYDDTTKRIYLTYEDTRDKTHHVTYRVIRAADNAEVFNQSYTDADLPLHTYYQIPAGWTNTSYRVHLTASGSPSFTNTWNQWVGTDGVATLPGELDKFAKMGIAFFLILFVAGLFSYYTGPQGAVVVSLFTAALVLWGWLPLPPAVVALAIIWAFLGLLGRTSGET